MQFHPVRRKMLISALGLSAWGAGCAGDTGNASESSSASGKAVTPPEGPMVDEKSGSPLPSWVPPAGVMRTLTRDNGSVSLMSSVNPCVGVTCAYSGSSGQAGIFHAWNSGAYVEGFGTLGSYVIAGGGHSDYWGNEIYAFDLATRTWSRVNNPAPFKPVIGESIFAPYYEFPSPWNSPAIPHTYDQFEQIPVSAAFPKGGIVLPVRAYVDNLARANCLYSHFFDFATLTWSRSTNDVGYATQDPTTTACHDPVRDGYWWFAPRGNGRVSFLDLKTRTWTPHQLRGLSNPYFGFDITSGFCSGNGVIALWNFYSGTARTLLVFDPATRTMAKPPTTGTAPDALTSMSWCPTNNRFYCYSGAGRRQVHTLTPPQGNPLTGTWAWDVENFLAESDSPAGDSGLNRRHNGFRWVPRLDCFVWADGNTRGVQLYRPSSAPAPAPNWVNPEPALSPTVVNDGGAGGGGSGGSGSSSGGTDTTTPTGTAVLGKPDQAATVCP